MKTIIDDDLDIDVYYGHCVRSKKDCYVYIFDPSKENSTKWTFLKRYKIESYTDLHFVKKTYNGKVFPLFVNGESQNEEQRNMVKELIKHKLQKMISIQERNVRNTQLYISELKEFIPNLDEELFIVSI